MFRAIDLRSPAIRSGAFAVFFAPLALLLLGSSMVDIQLRTATGQPLASVEGMIGLAMGAALLALVSINCDMSSSGLFVATATSVPVGILQVLGLVRVPGLFATLMSKNDLAAAVQWNLYPLAVTLILLGAALAVHSTHRAAEGEPASCPADPARTRARHQRIRAIVATTVLPLVLTAMVLYFRIAPRDVTRVAAEGLSGILRGHELNLPAALVAAGLLFLVALSSKWSMTGSQVLAWAVLVFPAYLLLPVWATLTGHVVTPGTEGVETGMSLVAPVIATLGLVLATSTMGVHWARRAHLPEDLQGHDGLPPASGVPDKPAEQVEPAAPAEPVEALTSEAPAATLADPDATSSR